MNSYLLCEFYLLYRSMFHYKMTLLYCDFENHSSYNLKGKGMCVYLPWFMHSLCLTLLLFYVFSSRCLNMSWPSKECYSSSHVSCKDDVMCCSWSCCNGYVDSCVTICNLEKPILCNFTNLWRKRKEWISPSVIYGICCKIRDKVPSTVVLYLMCKVYEWKWLHFCHQPSYLLKCVNYFTCTYIIMNFEW